MNELVAALRHCAKRSVCNGCPRCGKHITNCPTELYREAADAIEELSKYANTIMRLKSEGWYLQQTKHHDCYEAISTMPLPEPPKEGTT